MAEALFLLTLAAVAAVVYTVLVYPILALALLIWGPVGVLAFLALLRRPRVPHP